MEKFSQNNEQEIIKNYFEVHEHSRKHVFLDIGANDGITYSNTHACALRGWYGVLVEASPKAFERLKELYRGKPGISVYQLALLDHDGRIWLNESGPLDSPEDVALVSTVKDEEMDRFKNATKYNRVQVPCFKWETFLNASPHKDFDLISIDIEGAEMDVIPQIDFSGTSMVIIEWNGKPELKSQYNSVFEPYGFTILHENGENLIYVR